MPSLKDDPAIRLHSTRELFALAQAMARDAEAQYLEAARELRVHRNTALADLFTALADAERIHLQKIENRAEDLGLRTDPNLKWPVPATFDVSPMEAARPKLLTPYKAFACAVRHEQRVFKYWSYVAAHAHIQDVQTAAEHMAHEALSRMSLLRRKRRTAFYAEHGKVPLKKRKITLASLAALEERLADLIARDSSRSDQRHIAALATGARDAASKLVALAAHSPKFKAIAARLPHGCEEDAKAVSEYLADAYLELAGAAENETVLATFQELGRQAIQRLAALSSEGQRHDHIFPERRRRNGIE